MKVFISGPMQNLPNYNRREFDRTEHSLLKTKNYVMNPAILPDGFTHEEYLHVCYSMIDVCDAVLFLDGWEKSRGARMEHEYADKTGKLLMYMTDKELVVEI